MTNDAPETRASLLLRVGDPHDADAWREFVQIYWPVIRRVALRHGLQPTDADDVAQHALLAVAKTAASWSPDEDRGRFRTWLYRVAANAAINTLTRRKGDRGAGGDAAHLALQHAPDPRDATQEWLAQEHRRELFHWAARRAQPRFDAATWEAFWSTAVLGEPVPTVATRLNKSHGAVYAGRCRVMRAIREVLDEHGVRDDDGGLQDA